MSHFLAFSRDLEAWHWGAHSLSTRTREVLSSGCTCPLVTAFLQLMGVVRTGVDDFTGVGLLRGKR